MHEIVIPGQFHTLATDDLHIISDISITFRVTNDLSSDAWIYHEHTGLQQEEGNWNLCDYIQMCQYSLFRNLFLAWTLKSLAKTMPVWVVTQQFSSLPFHCWGICWAMTPAWFSPTSPWKNWRPSSSFFMVVAAGSYDFKLCVDKLLSECCGWVKM